jgi:hypothetical protein
VWVPWPSESLGEAKSPGSTFPSLW